MKQLWILPWLKQLRAFQCLQNISPDMIIVHGDRVETAGAIVGSLNNILVAHRRGEISGTVDELIRHSVDRVKPYSLFIMF
jgi:UDP-N-acetylglucosamine 2-epimerase